MRINEKIVKNTKKSINKVKNFTVSHMVKTLRSYGVECIISVVDDYFVITTEFTVVFIDLDRSLEFYFDFITGKNTFYFGELIKELKQDESDSSND